MSFSMKRPVDQTTHVQQALRRLKYLHTSLANPVKSKASNLKQLQKTSSLQPINGSDLPGYEKSGDFEDENNTDKQYFLALTPENDHKEGPIRNKPNSRERCGWRPVRKGRAPLASPSSYLNPTFLPLSTRKESPWDRQAREGSIQKNISLKGNDRKAKSAPASGGLPSLNAEQFDCVQCFTNEMERHRKDEGPAEFNTNIKISRIAFSARPKPKEYQSEHPKSNKLISERAFQMPQSLYGGWGVRTRKRNTDIKQKNSRQKPDDSDLTFMFQTLRIEPRNTEGREIRNTQDGKGLLYPPPPAPPTPVRQIDIKIPEGYLVQCQLQPVA